MTPSPAPPGWTHWQIPPTQFWLRQSDARLQPWPLGQAGQVPPPQSMPVSLPFLTTSLQVGF
jgi:hypothetical protein